MALKVCHVSPVEYRARSEYIKKIYSVVLRSFSVKLKVLLRKKFKLFQRV